MPLAPCAPSKIVPGKKSRTQQRSNPPLFRRKITTVEMVRKIWSPTVQVHPKSAFCAEGLLVTSASVVASRAKSLATSLVQTKLGRRSTLRRRNHTRLQISWTEERTRPAQQRHHPRPRKVINLNTCSLTKSDANSAQHSTSIVAQKFQHLT